MASFDSVKPEHLRPYFPALDDGEHYKHTTSKSCLSDTDKETQEYKNNRTFFMSITNGGLRYNWAKYYKAFDHVDDYFRSKTKAPRHVIIVGAGMAGLSAAFELEQVGHEVTILELQGRVGGRIKTFYDGFADGLHAEGGAMRIPTSHFMTKHYIDLFGIQTRPFQNYNKKGLLNLYGTTITMEEWIENNTKWCDKFWKGWDARFPSLEMKDKLGIHSIMDYYEKTVAPVIEELKQDTSPEGWEKWVEKYSKWSMEGYFKSDENQDNSCFLLRPWPSEAIEAYKIATYMPIINRSLVEILRGELSRWWTDPLYAPVKGMESFPKAFMEKNKNGWNKHVHLSRKVQFGRNVESVSKTEDGKVNVSGRNDKTGEDFSFIGDAVIITVPLTVLRQMDVPLTLIQTRAISNISYEASTRILLQCRTRFWQKTVGHGGSSKTNQPIGQLHYPDWKGCGIPVEERGILLCYNWGHDATIMSSQPPEKCIMSAVKQIQKFHPEIAHEFEVGKVQYWDRDSSSQGAFAVLDLGQYNDSWKQLMKNKHPVYLAGDTLSWSHCWIEGAIESGLRAAYEVFCHFEVSKSVSY